MTMTTEQRNLERARRRLGEYRRATRELQYLEDRILSIEAKVMRAGKPLDTHAGWTGRYWGRSKCGKGWMYSCDPDELVNPRQELKIPRAKSGTRDPKAGETLLIEYIDQQLDSPPFIGQRLRCPPISSFRLDPLVTLKAQRNKLRLPARECRSQGVFRIFPKG
jgi:hypothetical protein